MDELHKKLDEYEKILEKEGFLKICTECNKKELVRNFPLYQTICYECLKKD